MRSLSLRGILPPSGNIDEARPVEGLVHVALTQINLCLECPVTRLLSYRRILLGFTLSKSEICRLSHIDYHLLIETKKYSRISMARISLGPWKFVRDMGSSSH